MAQAKRALAVPASATPITKGRKKLSEAEKAARAEFLKNESKADKFKRLAIPRVNKALKAIAAVGKLAAYKPTDEQIASIMTAIANSAQAAQNRMEGVRNESYTFTLS